MEVQAKGFRWRALREEGPPHLFRRFRKNLQDGTDEKRDNAQKKYVNFSV